jgi:group I intron endonuclease
MYIIFFVSSSQTRMEKVSNQKVGIGCIYLITNHVNNKFYVGQHNKANVNERWRAHKQKATNGYTPALYGAMRKYGIHNFTIDVIYRSTIRSLDFYEQMFAQLLDTYVINGKGYNMAACGGGKGKYQITEETRARLRDSHMGHKKTPQQLERMSESMKTHHAENRESRRFVTEKIAEKLKGRSNSTWGSHSEESNRKISDTLKGRGRSDEFCAKVSASRKVGSTGHKYIQENSWGFYVRIDNRQHGTFNRQYKTLEEAITHRDQFISSKTGDKRITATGEKFIRPHKFSGYAVYINNKTYGKFSKTFPTLASAISARDKFLSDHTSVTIPTTHS